MKSRCEKRYVGRAFWYIKSRYCPTTSALSSGSLTTRVWPFFNAFFYLFSAALKNSDRAEMISLWTTISCRSLPTSRTTVSLGWWLKRGFSGWAESAISAVIRCLGIGATDTARYVLRWMCWDGRCRCVEFRVLVGGLLRNAFQKD
jgi:hypothetical protein